MWGKALLLVLFAFVAFRAAAAEDCMKAARAVPAGAVPSAEDFVAVACGAAKPDHAVRYDRGLRALRVVRELRAGDVIAGFPSGMMARVSPGQKLYVTVHVGPVTVQREVQALQSANPGQKLFVRAADGQVMSVRYSEGEQ